MEELGMARQSKREYLRSIHKRYRQARRKEKTAMLEEFSRVCGYNRKYAIWLLSRSLSNTAARKAVSRRSTTYSKASITVLAKIWEASGYLCSQRLKAALPQWLPWIKKHFDLTAELEEQLLAISARQMDRRLFSHKRIVKRRLYGTTRPGSLLKAMIPIKTDHWDVTLPGYLGSIWSRIRVAPGFRACPVSVAGPRPERRRSRDSSLRSAPRLPRLSLTGHGSER